MFAIVKSRTSKVCSQYYGQTFEIKEMTPIRTIMNINGQESILSHHDVLIIDIENEYREAVEELEEILTLQKKQRIKTKDMEEKVKKAQHIVLCLKDYTAANNINIEL